MDFKKISIDFFASFIIVLRRCILLIIVPYKTLRKISKEEDYGQVFIIFILVLLYFNIGSSMREREVHPQFVFLIFFMHFFLTVFFFYFFSSRFTKNIHLSSFIFTFSYALLPTLLWFITNSFTYLLFPPPRTPSLLGVSFSILFIGFSMSLFIWKSILLYLAIRFSSKLGFYRIMYMMVLYLCLFIPYTILMYYYKIFRIPFI